MKMKWNYFWTSIYNCTTKIVYYSGNKKLKQLHDSMFWWRSFSM